MESTVHLLCFLQSPGQPAAGASSAGEWHGHPPTASHPQPHQNLSLLLDSSSSLIPRSHQSVDLVCSSTKYSWNPVPAPSSSRPPVYLIWCSASSYSWPPACPVFYSQHDPPHLCHFLSFLLSLFLSKYFKHTEKYRQIDNSTQVLTTALSNLNICPRFFVL